ncbi:MAG: electron transfer flavoprotein subunit beta/FixA family protein [Flavobacteriales bacterium]|nr:electron transfer flavoprotein subunit beta/FixA family protein [Flavobacteriales bacterium]
MKILVCISHVPDTTSKINFTNNNTEFDSNGITFVINPYDEFGLTRAMQIKEATGATVTVINVGSASTEPTLRKALAIGADDAVRINAEPTDAAFVARLLADYAEEQNFDLIITGRESIDYNGGAVPGMLATYLDIPFVNACIGLELKGTKSTVIREIDGGKETLEGNLPMLLAGQKGLVEEKDLRIPAMRGIMMARKKPLTVIEAGEAVKQTSVLGFELPEAKAACTMIDADNVEQLVELLHSEAKVI